jgi:hypothetical protein
MKYIHRSPNGMYARKYDWKDFLAITILSALFLYSIYSVFTNGASAASVGDGGVEWSGSSTANELQHDSDDHGPSPALSTSTSDMVAPCREIATGEYDCTSAETQRELGKYIKWVDVNGKSVKARITWYSVKDSCHFPAKDGGCYSANYPHKIQPGDMACPKQYKFGTKVVFNGVTYTCNDRTADWVQAKWGVPTFDIFVATHSESKGRVFGEVIIK